MSFLHGKGTYFALDLADGTGPSDVRTLFRSASGLVGKSERPMTSTFGTTGHRRQVLGLRDGGPISLGGVYQATAGTKVHGKSVRVLQDQYALYSYLRSTTLRRTIDLPDTTTYGETWRRRQVAGQLDGGVSFGGAFDAQSGATDPVYIAAMASESPALISISHSGFAIGNMVDLGQFVQTVYDIESPHDNLVPVTAEFDQDDRIDLGVSLHDLTAETAAGATNYASVNETAATSEGWVAHLHATAFSGWTDATIKIQDSADNAAWADLSGGAFTAVTAATKQRLEGAAAATVRQYVRAVCTTTGGAGSVTFQVSIARRGFVYGSAGTYRHLVGLYGKSASTSFQYGPDGSASGKPRRTGEVRLSSLELTLPHDDLITLSAEFLTDGTITADTF